MPRTNRYCTPPRCARRVVARLPPAQVAVQRDGVEQRLQRVVRAQHLRRHRLAREVQRRQVAARRAGWSCSRRRRTTARRAAAPRRCCRTGSRAAAARRPSRAGRRTARAGRRRGRCARSSAGDVAQPRLHRRARRRRRTAAARSPAPAAGRAARCRPASARPHRSGVRSTGSSASASATGSTVGQPARDRLRGTRASSSAGRSSADGVDLLQHLVHERAEGRAGGQAVHRRRRPVEAPTSTRAAARPARRCAPAAPARW